VFPNDAFYGNYYETENGILLVRNLLVKDYPSILRLID